MKYIVTLLISLCILVHTDSIAKNKTVEIRYQSELTSLTKIELVLYSNHKFALYINIFGDNFPTTKSKGTWHEFNNYYVLHFYQRRCPALPALFPESTDTNNSIEIINQDSFKFKKSAIELIIYGVKCIKGAQTIG